MGKLVRQVCVVLSIVLASFTVGLVHSPAIADVKTAGSLTASPASGATGTPLVLRGSVPPRHSRAVILQRKSGSRWTKVAQRRSSSAGRFRFELTIPATTTTFRVYAPAMKDGPKRYAAVVTPARQVITTPAPPAVTADLHLGDCAADPTLTLDSDPAVVEPGQHLDYSATIRNDALGACLTSSSVPTVRGDVSLMVSAAPSASSCDGVADGSACAVDVAMWLEIHTADADPATWTVLPAALGLTRHQGENPMPDSDCPGGDPTGCTGSAQVSYGNVRYSQDPPFSLSCVPANGACSAPTTRLDFEYFPALSEEDLALLDGCAEQTTCDGARLVVATTTTSSEVPRLSASAAVDLDPDHGTATDLTLKIVAPDDTTTTRDVDDLAPGEQADLTGVAGYDVPAEAATELRGSSTLSFSAGSSIGTRTAEAITAIGAKPANTSPITLAVDKSAITADTAQTLFVSATGPAGVTGPVNVQSVDGPARTTIGTLTDDGAGGDIVAGDSVFSGEVSASLPQGKLVLQATTLHDGTELASDQVTVDVTAPGVPTDVAPVSSSAVVTANDETTYAGGQVLLRFDDAADLSAMQAAADAIEGTLAGRVGDVWQVDIPTVTELAKLDAVLAKASQQPHVIGAEPNAFGHATEVVPNDSQYAAQYAPRVTRTDEAWVVSQGSPVIVAVGDTGIDANHPDLAGRVLRGYNTFNGSHDTSPGPNELHGTHVAGIVAAAGNNAQGVAGVNWKARILPIKLCNQNGCQDEAHLAETIRYAASHGARVLNLSVGGYGRSEVVAQALQDAYFADMLVVTAAGNCGDPTNYKYNGCHTVNQSQYPAAYSSSETFSSWFGLFKRTYVNSLVTVGSTDADDHRSAFSNHGDYVDISAPGTDILSTLPNGKYGTESGTSMASPFVAGVASLLLSRHPNWLDVNVRARLVTTVRPLSASGMGSGRVDAFSALTNGGYDTGNLAEWTASGTAQSVKQLGPIRPTDGTARMAMITSGPDEANDDSTLRQRIPIASGTGPVKVRLRYNYVTEEYPEFVGSDFNDIFTYTLVLDDGTRVPVTTETVNATHFTPISGIDMPGGDQTVGQSGWQTATTVINPPQAGATLVLNVHDVGDSIYDSVVLLDRLELR